MCEQVIWFIYEVLRDLPREPFEPEEEPPDVDPVESARFGLSCLLSFYYEPIELVLPGVVDALAVELDVIGVESRVERYVDYSGDYAAVEAGRRVPDVSRGLAAVSGAGGARTAGRYAQRLS